MWREICQIITQEAMILLQQGQFFYGFTAKSSALGKKRVNFAAKSKYIGINIIYNDRANKYYRQE